MTMTFNESRWPKENAIKVVKGNGVSKSRRFHGSDVCLLQTAQPRNALPI